MTVIFFFFFFQAEDGIRDLTVTGVQTCALPILMNGVKALETVLRRAGYASVAAAVAEHTIFLNPMTVEQTGGQPVFPVIRDMFDAVSLGPCLMAARFYLMTTRLRP